MRPISMNKQSFRAARDGDRPVLVEYQAPWCVYCRRIGPAMDKIAAQYADTLTVGQVNIDDEPSLAQREEIEIVPTLVLYRGGQALGSVVAPDSKAAIERFIQETLNS